MDSNILESLLITDNQKIISDIKDFKTQIESYNRKINELEEILEYMLDDNPDKKLNRKINRYKNKSPNDIIHIIYEYKHKIYDCEVKIQNLKLKLNIKSPIESISLEGFFGSSLANISEGEMKRSPYYQMSDRDLATTLVDRLYNNRMIKLADKSDSMVQKCLMMMRYSAYEYFEYNISGIPVAVGRPNKKVEPTFTIYIYTMGSSMPRAVSSYKNELIKNFIIEDKRKK